MNSSEEWGTMVKTEKKPSRLRRALRKWNRKIEARLAPILAVPNVQLSGAVVAGAGAILFFALGFSPIALALVFVMTAILLVYWERGRSEMSK